jgi:hypothetical protein
MSTPMTVTKSDRPTWGTTAVAAVAGMLVRLCLITIRFDHVVAVVRRLAGRARRQASDDEVLCVLRAVDAGVEWVPFRMACLERSLTAVILLATRRLGVTWVVGVRTPPVAAHAWLVNLDNHPIGEPVTTLTYSPLVIVAASTNTHRSSA